MQSHPISRHLRWDVIARYLVVVGSVLMLSSTCLSWLIIPFQSNFLCSFPAHSGCPVEGVIALRVSLLDVFTHPVRDISNLPITYIAMIPVIAATFMGLIAFFTKTPTSHTRVGFLSIFIIGMVAQELVTALVNALPAVVIGSATAFFPLPYIVYTCLLVGSLAWFQSHIPRKTL